MGLNIVVGYAGLLDLGYAAFFAIGAYTIGFLTSPSSVFVQRGWVPELLQNFWPALAVSWVVAAIFGVLLGAPTLRLRGDYLAIVTLGFGEIVPNFFLNAESRHRRHARASTRSPSRTSSPSSATRFRFGPTDQRNWYWLILRRRPALVLHDPALLRLAPRPHLEAIREDEIAAASMGVNLVTTKLWAFALGASFAGFAGSVYASLLPVRPPEPVRVLRLDHDPVDGHPRRPRQYLRRHRRRAADRLLRPHPGRASSTGRCTGSATRIGIEWLAEHNVEQDRFLVFGLALVLMMLLRPEGLFPNRRRQAELQPETETSTRRTSSSNSSTCGADDEPAAAGSGA